jgi:hypothetical protein
MAEMSMVTPIRAITVYQVDAEMDGNRGFLVHKINHWRQAQVTDYEDRSSPTPNTMGSVLVDEDGDSFLVKESPEAITRLINTAGMVIGIKP